jgi:hypothetical protein
MLSYSVTAPYPWAKFCLLCVQLLYNNPPHLCITSMHPPRSIISLPASATVYNALLQVRVEPRSHLILLAGMMLLWWRWMLLVLEAQIHVWAEVWEVGWSVHAAVVAAVLTADLEALHRVTALVVLGIVAARHAAGTALLVRVIRQAHHVISKAGGL